MGVVLPTVVVAVRPIRIRQAYRSIENSSECSVRRALASLSRRGYLTGVPGESRACACRSSSNIGQARPVSQHFSNGQSRPLIAYINDCTTVAETFLGLLPTISTEQDLISSKANNLSDPPHPSPVIRLIETTSLSIPTILAGLSIETR